MKKFFRMLLISRAKGLAIFHVFAFLSDQNGGKQSAIFNFAIHISLDYRK